MKKYKIMAEIIYTHIDPLTAELGTSIAGRQRALVQSIKKDGIKFPLVMLANNGHADWDKGFNKFNVGNQRILIALGLGIREMPVVAYSSNSTGFEGIPITCIDDIAEICGEGIKTEPTYRSIISALSKVKKWNNK